MSISLAACRKAALFLLLPCAALAGDPAPASPSEAEAAGARVPFVTVEAEDPGNATSGKIVRLVGLPKPNEQSPELEASGRGYVSLDATGQYLDIPSASEVNTMVIRHCTPDAPEGGGTTATLSLYVNGEKRQTLVLPSRHNWLYGKPGANGQSNDPKDGAPHVFWEESRFFISGGVKKGETIRLKRDEGDAAVFYRIDCVDLERVGPPLDPPAPGSFLSVLACGAKGNGKDDDTAAIAACVAVAKEQGKTVWLPAGDYCQSASVVLDGVKVRGAGMWYTNLLGTVDGTRTDLKFGGNLGFVLAGKGSEVRDLSIDAPNNMARMAGGKPFTSRFGVADWRVENVWITHTNTGFWIGGANGGVIRGCRVRGTYADGINLNRGSSGNLVEDNHVRGGGDDGMAILSETNHPNDAVTMNDTLRHNTVCAIWWGSNCGLAGGGGHVIEYNYLADNALLHCMGFANGAAYPMYPITGATVAGNVIVRGGGNMAGQQRGALYVASGGAAISNVVFRDNRIVSPIFRGIQLVGTFSQEVVFEDNVISNPGRFGVDIMPGVVGAGTFTRNEVTGVNDGAAPFRNGCGGGYVVRGVGNSWDRP